MSKVLIRTDRNGTKYWSDDKCPKCGGTGYINGYEHVEGGRCFLCGGSGFHEHHWKEMTPEYSKKLADRRRAKAMAKASETNKGFLQKIGFSEDGKAWVVCGDTYSIKDDLRAEGAKFGAMGWHFDHEVERECIQIDINDVACTDINGVYFLKADWFIKDFMKNEMDARAPKSDSEYIGEIGEKLSLNVKYVGSHSYETHFTYRGETHYILKFQDENENTVIWNTSSWQDLEEGKEYQIKGIVKEHSEYRGDKQTVLTRCKIQEV